MSEKKLCRNCLSPSHKTLQCNSLKNCIVCNKRHYTLLHLDTTQPQQLNTTFRERPRSNSNSQSPSATNNTTGSEAASTSSVQSTTTACSTFCSKPTEILLATALENMVSRSGEVITARALLDNGSQTSFITESLANRINAKFVSTSIQITSISDQIKLSN